MWRASKVKRDPDLQRLFDRLEAAVIADARRDETRVTGRTIFAALSRRAGPVSSASPQALPVCTHLPGAIELTKASPVAALAEALAVIAPRLVWSRRHNSEPQMVPFHDGHANAMIAGPGGLELRDDVWIGVSLMAPHILYVDHDHPPEEVYVALTPGEWWNAEMDWTSPGIGGTIYNPPGILHSMRSREHPFLALWLLPAA